MKIVGLTGSIGMGKSTTARLFRDLGVDVFDADAAVHRLMAPGGKAVGAVGRLFPDSLVGGRIDRAKLGQAVFGQPEKLRRLEAILHPMVRAEQQIFLKSCRRRRRAIVVLDIPLLLEKDGWRMCDRIVVVTAPAFLQAARVLARPGQSPDRLAQVRRAQMPDIKKRRAADWIIQTGRGKAPALASVRRFLRRLPQMKGPRRCARLSWIPKPPGWTR